MMDLRRYPLDEQNCTLEIESCEYGGGGGVSESPVLGRKHGVEQFWVRTCGSAVHPAHPVLTERRRNVDKAALKMLRKA